MFRLLPVHVPEPFNIPCIATLREHTGFVRTCAYSPNGEFFVTGSGDKTLMVWDARNRHVVAVLVGHTRGIYTCAYSPCSNFIVSGSSDHTLRVWDARTYQCIATLAGHEGPVYACAYAPSGKYIVSGATDKKLRLWNISDLHFPRCVGIFEGHQDVIYGCTYDHAGHFIISGSKDGTFKLWDLTSVSEVQIRLACVRTSNRYPHEIFVCTYSPDGHSVLLAFSDGTLQIVNMTTFSTLAILRGHADTVTTAIYTPDGQYIISGSYDQSIKVWNREGQCLATLLGHEGMVRSCTYSNTLHGQYLLSTSEDGSVKVWDVSALNPRIPTPPLPPRIPTPQPEPIPAEYLCPIMQSTMEDPVVAEDGHSYERVAILQWLDTHNTSPLTRGMIGRNVISNINLRNAIRDWLQRYDPQRERY